MTFRLPLVAGLFALLSLFFACKGDTTAPSAAEPEAAEVSPASMARLTPAEMKVLIDSVDYIDYVFYELDFSMSMDNASGIQYALAQVGPKAAKRNPNCKAIGRVFYQIKGRNAKAADMYFSNGCTYFEFVEGNQVVAANQMSDVGIEFLNNQFGQIIDNYERVQ